MRSQKEEKFHELIKTLKTEYKEFLEEFREELIDELKGEYKPKKPLPAKYKADKSSMNRICDSF